MKICPKCKNSISIEEQTTNPYCKKCRAEYAKEWRKKIRIK